MLLTHSPPSQAARALATARERFPNLRESGIMPRAACGATVNLDDVSTALRFLRRCRHTKYTFVHTLDLQRVISRWTQQPVSVGAIISASIYLQFEVKTHHGMRVFFPHAVVNAHRDDIQQAMRARR